MLNHIFGKPLHPDLPSRLCGGEKIVNLCLEPSDSRYSLIWSLRSLFSGIISDISWTIDLRGAHFEAQGIENIPSHRKTNFLVMSKYSKNPQPRSLRQIIFGFRATATQPPLTRSKPEFLLLCSIISRQSSGYIGERATPYIKTTIN